jgi:hypothetical protein
MIVERARNQISLSARRYAILIGMEQTHPIQSRWGGIRRTLGSAWRYAWPVIRQVLGWLCIFLGLLGLLLPLLQGIPLLVIGITLVGRRHPLIRWASVRLKLGLRRWAALPTPLIGPLGRLALRVQRETSRQLRHLHRWYAERRRRA